MATTKHTCNEGRGPVFGRKIAGCPRCDELIAGAPAVVWNIARKAKQEAELIRAIRSHDFAACARRNVVCTHFEW